MSTVVAPPLPLTSTCVCIPPTVIVTLYTNACPWASVTMSLSSTTEAIRLHDDLVTTGRKGRNDIGSSSISLRIAPDHGLGINNSDGSTWDSASIWISYCS